MALTYFYLNQVPWRKDYLKKVLIKSWVGQSTTAG